MFLFAWHLLNSMDLAYRSGMIGETEYLNIDIMGQTGRISLNRPKALHALTTAMCHQIRQTLETWWHDDAIKQIIICATEGRAFCAGGDIREALHMITYPEPDMPDYFEAEYSMDMVIAGYPKPVISLANGLTMGGGAGLLFNASHPVITDQIDFTMPETGIGLFPDVAASLFLRRATGSIGLYIGLTGTRIGYGDMIGAGLMDSYIHHDDLADVMAAICAMTDADHLDDILASFTRYDAEPALLMPHLDWINDMLSHDRLEDIRDQAAMSDHVLAAPLHQSLTRRCPLSLKTTHRLLAGKNPPDGYISALLLDYCLAMRILAYPDFAEGVRAAVIDKDQWPVWSHQCLEDVSDTMIDDLFDDRDRPRFAVPSVLL
jgi:enoyl-CoA hydratase